MVMRDVNPADSTFPTCVIHLSIYYLLPCAIRHEALVSVLRGIVGGKMSKFRGFAKKG